MQEPDGRAPWRSRAINLILLIAAVAVAFTATKVADSIAGLMMGSHPYGLIFPPHSQATYHTTEFDYTVRINSLGFRDREFDVARSKTCRLIAVGDSFTFGWGVSLEDSWPKRLETGLAQAGFDVEVANLGFPGGNPIDYANIVGHAVPMLAPDLVMVAVLQGDDLQLGGGPHVGTGGWKGAVRRMVDPVARIVPAPNRRFRRSDPPDKRAGEHDLGGAGARHPGRSQPR